MFATVVIFLLLLSLLVLVHEWGHFTAARRMGIRVEEFGLGFPPRIFSWKSKSGVMWSVNLIPLGGFVKIFDESGEHRDDSGSFAGKGILPRAFVLCAGVFMNLVLAAVLFSVGFATGLPSAIEGASDPAAIISNRAIDIVDVVSGSAADNAGIVPGDRLLTVDGTVPQSGENARALLAPKADGSPVRLTLLHKGAEETLDVTPQFLAEVNRNAVGVALVETGTVRYPWYLAPVKGVQAMVQSTGDVIAAFAGLIASVVTRGSVQGELSGPVGIAVLTGQIVSLGFAHVLQFAAMLSVNLAVINIVPFPALDGGRLFFLAIEAIRRKPNSAPFERTVHALGFAVLLLLVIVVTYKDIVHLF